MTALDPATWRTAAAYRSEGRRVPKHVEDDRVIRYVPGVDSDGTPLVRLEVRPRDPVPVDWEARRARDAAEAARTEERRKTSCNKTVECGGWCRLAPNHDGPCLCDGDTDGPGSCPA